MKNIILATGAHPDDIELGCGGTLKKHIISKDKVYGLVLTKGEKGDHCPRGNEYNNSSNFLGMEDMINFGLEDGEVRDNHSTISRIEELIQKLNPVIVYTHTPNDRHQDHRYCSNAVKSAARFVPKLLLFETPSSTSEFTPHYFSDITKTLDFKIKALRKYRSQIKKGIVNLDWIKEQAGYWGHKLRINNKKKIYAEAFEINHIILDDNFENI